MTDDVPTQLLEAELERALAQIDGAAPLLARMARYHLGLAEPSGTPTDVDTRRAVQGKRMRPQVAFLACAAVQGNPVAAAPLAAAIELLHNFTLVHDDIQDRSPNRRHRPTVWRIWGDAQAINAGDALFAAAQRTLLRTDRARVPATVLLELLDAFNATTIEIVRGQVLDLEFESQQAVGSGEYLTMIAGKTAAIVRFAAWAGALAGGASRATADVLGAMGEALGMGFQVRDDVLGIWGARSDTGKDEADDIRRRKKSLPVLLLHERASEGERERLAAIYRADEIEPEGVSEVLTLLDRHDIAGVATSHVRTYHEAAATALERARPLLDPTAADGLASLIARMDTRVS